jgi:glycosyltransferase involved in cell wall biosynthesis
MKWYSKYLQVYEQPFASAPPEVVGFVKKKLRKLSENKQPLASVVLICHNEETRLLSCLWSLCDNECDFPIEILAVNNNSTDRTEAVMQQLGVTYFNETKKSPGHARQCGLNQAKGKYHICIDTDTIYPSRYIKTHVKQLMKPGVTCTFSLWSFIPDERHSATGLWWYEALRDLHLRIQSIQRPELCVRGMTFGFNTELGRKFGFRTDIIRGEDGALALAMKPYGKLVFIHSGKARVMTGYGTLNNDGSLFNSFKTRLVKAFKGAGSMFTRKNEYKDEDNNLIKNK